MGENQDHCPHCGLRASHVDDVQERPVGWPSNIRRMCANEHVWFEMNTTVPVAAVSPEQQRGAFLRQLAQWRRELRADLIAYDHGEPLDG